MEKSGHRGQIWITALIINAVVFSGLWFAIQSVAGKTPEPKPVQLEQPTTPGSSYGNLTQLIGENSAVQPDLQWQDNSLPETPKDQNLTDINPSVPEHNQTLSNAPIDMLPQKPQVDNRWVDEFYLDKGPVLSFSPRVNSDGSPRAHPTNLDYFKMPTYEDLDAVLDVNELIQPVMTPQTLPISIVPPELRSRNFSPITVKIRLDARGRVIGRPTVVRSSGFQVIDQIVLQLIMDPMSVQFTPARRKSNNEPVHSDYVFTIFWEGK